MLTFRVSCSSGFDSWSHMYRSNLSLKSFLCTHFSFSHDNLTNNSLRASVSQKNKVQHSSTTQVMKSTIHFVDLGQLPPQCPQVFTRTGNAQNQAKVFSNNSRLVL